MRFMSFFSVAYLLHCIILKVYFLELRTLKAEACHIQGFSVYKNLHFLYSDLQTFLPGLNAIEVRYTSKNIRW